MNKISLLAATIINLLLFDPRQSSTQIEPSSYIKNQILIKTETRFSQKEVVVKESIPFETKYKEDNDLEIGNTKVLDEGENGNKIKTYLVTYYDVEELDRQLLKTEVISPKDKVVLNGTKIVWKKESKERCGEFKYWQKYENVYMTTYTPQCEGCNAWTSIGLKAGYGIIAVDPKKIPYWTKVCIPRYGIAIAGDTGGAMRSYPGLLIDLGFASLLPKDKWLTTGRYDMYILNNEDKFKDFYSAE